MFCVFLYQSYVEYDALYRSRVEKQGYRVSTHSVQCFDGVWSFALALNKTITGKLYTYTHIYILYAI